MDKHKAPLLIDRDKCAPCSELLCVGVCPQGILETDADNKPRITDAASCTQCGVCADLCPSKAIVMAHSEQSRDR